MSLFSDRIRDELQQEIAECPTCGNRRMTITALASVLGQPPSSVSRYLAGGKPSVALLDAAEEVVRARENEKALPQEAAAEFLGTA